MENSLCSGTSFRHENAERIDEPKVQNVERRVKDTKEKRAKDYECSHFRLLKWAKA